MFIRTMRRHNINHQLQAARMGLRNQRVKIRQRSVFRIDVAIIRYVITKILLWRRKERADPDGVNAQIGDIIQSGDNTLQVADTIAV